MSSDDTSMYGTGAGSAATTLAGAADAGADAEPGDVAEMDDGFGGASMPIDSTAINPKYTRNAFTRVGLPHRMTNAGLNSPTSAANIAAPANNVNTADTADMDPPRCALNILTNTYTTKRGQGNPAQAPPTRPRVATTMPVTQLENRPFSTHMTKFLNYGDDSHSYSYPQGWK
ncbi:hypothetical protein [Nitratidesulfovibrio termitidis]|uniref:hypothetical protein n=1 Tax=Nitratidesulfovibrio termitidis TaxID=42252 RepID=UPI0018DDAF6D|nr:hypothetical protein [Nitratidesulfovibrio termitidis]